MKTVIKRKPGSPFRLAIKYNCDSCHLDITECVRATCSKCENIDFCLNCFSNHSEAGAHKKEHPYFLKIPMDFPIFDPSWRADEELLLIEGCQKFGFGNWKAISEYVGRKSSSQCKEQYEKIYISSSIFPLPNTDIPIIYDIYPVDIKKITQPIENFKKFNHHGNFLNTHKIQGYIPLRGEFEIEYMNEAERLIMDINTSSDDSEIEARAKDSQIEYYQLILSKRNKRKEYINKVGIDRIIKDLKSKNSLAPIKRFLSHEQFNLFKAGIEREDFLYKRIKNIEVNYLKSTNNFFDSNFKTLLINSLPFHEKNLCLDLKIDISEYLYLREAILFNIENLDQLLPSLLSDFGNKIEASKISQIFSFFKNLYFTK